jgi:hypothetical protein
LADRTKSRIDLLKNAKVTQRRVAELERELKQVREVPAVEKKKLKVSSLRRSSRPRWPMRKSMF